MSTLAERLAAAAARRQAEEATAAPEPPPSPEPTPEPEPAPAPVSAPEAAAPPPAPAAPAAAAEDLLDATIARSVGTLGTTPEPSAPSTAKPVPSAGRAGEGVGRHRPLPPRSEIASTSGPRKVLAAQQADRIEEIKASVHAQLLQQLGPQLYDAKMDQADLEGRVKVVLQEVLSAQERPLSSADRVRVTQEISDEILGYGPIEAYLRDPEVSEVMVNGPHQVWVERNGRLESVDTVFTDEAHLRRIIDKIVSRIGRRVDESSPMVDARLPDGSRVNAVVPPLAIDGSALTIRKFAADPFTVDDLISFGSLTPRTADFLEACVRGRLNIIVSGSTGAGKTTTLNVLSSFIPSDERIVTIEDAAELQLKQDHVVRLESRPPNIEGKGEVQIRDLVKNSLRMRPDRIIVGEVRDASALDMLQAMSTGHDGSIATAHSNGPRDTLSRIETMVLMAGMDLPIRAIREQMASAIDLIVHQTRFKDGSRHITHITEVERMEGEVVTLQDVFVYDHGAGFDAAGRSLGRLRSTGLRPKFLEKMAYHNVTVDPMVFALDRQ